MVATVFSSCSNEETFSNDGTAPMTVKVNNNIPASRSLVTDNVLPAQSTIGVMVVDDSGEKYDGNTYINIPYYSENGTEWSVKTGSIAPALSFTTGKTIAYYPWSESVTDFTQIPVTTKEKEDYMFSDVVNVNNTSHEAAYTMNHALAAVRLVFNQGTYKGGGQITSITVQGENLTTDATLDATTGVLKDFSMPFPVNVLTALTMDGAACQQDILVIPTGDADVVSILVEMDGTQYTATTGSLVLESGHIYTYKLTPVPETATFTVDKVQVDAWVSKDYTLPELEPQLPWVTATYNVSQVAIDMDVDFMTGLYVEAGVFEITDLVDRMIVDGVETAVAETGFVTAGEHTVKFLFKDNAKSIPMGFFMQNFCLTGIEWKGSGWEIQNVAFYMCPGLKTVPDWHTMSSVGMGAFICTGFEKLELPADWPTMAMMENGLFPMGFCTSPSMTSITVHPDNPLFYVPEGSNALMIKSDAAEGMDGFLFSGCPTTVIPDNTAYIADYAFAGVYNPKNLEEMMMLENPGDIPQQVEIVLPESVIYVSTGAFTDNFYLTSVTFGTNVLGLYDPFEPLMIGCPSLNTIISKAVTAPSFVNSSTVSETGTLYVPQGATGYDEWIRYLGEGWILQTIE